MLSRSVRARYVNLFVLCSRADAIVEIGRALDRLCTGSVCTYNVIQSRIVDRFFYIKIHPLNVENLENMKKSLSTAIDELKDLVSWYKIEVIEVR